MRPEIPRSPIVPPRSRASGLIVALLAMAAGANLLLPPMLDVSQPLVWAAAAGGLMWGLPFAELGLLAIWASLGPRKALVQLPATMLVLFGLYAAFLLGLLRMEGWSQPVRDMGRGVLFLPLLFLAVQSPLWVFRILGGHRIALRTDREQPSPIGSRQVGLRHLLAATAVVAVALSLARVGIPKPTRAASGPDPAFALLAACLLCGAWSALSILPCVWAAYVARGRGLATVAIAAYMTGMTIVVWGILQVASSTIPPSEFAVFLFVFHGTLAAVTLGTLHLLRACGYVLLRAGSERPAGAADASRNETASTEPSPGDARRSG